MAPLLIFAFLSLLCISRADNRAHGLANESPVAISPEAYTFFHPHAQQPSTSNPCGSSNCSRLPLAATVQSAPGHESKSTTSGSRGLEGGGIAGITVSFLFVCLIGMGVFYVMKKRKANLQRAQLDQPAV